MTNNLNFLPRCSFKNKDQVHAIGNWRRFFALLLIVVMGMIIVSAFDWLSYNKAKNSLYDSDKGLLKAQAALKNELGLDTIGSLRQDTLEELEGFADYFEALTHFSVNQLWVNELTVDLLPEVDPHIKELIIGGQTQIPKKAQNFFNLVSEEMPYADFNIHLSILTQKKQPLTKREQRLKAAGVDIAEDTVPIYEFAVRTPEKKEPGVR